MNKSSEELRKMAVLAMLTALAFVAVAFCRIPITPVVPFLNYEPKDVILTIGAFWYGPLAGAAMSVLVAFLELVTISNTGIIGFVMNILSSCLFVCTASLLYHRKKTLSRAIIGLVCGALLATGAMLLWNILITPLYMEIPREEIIKLLLPGFLPFNLIKTGINAALTMLLYKHVSAVLRRAHLLPATGKSATGKVWIPVMLGTTVVLALLVMVILAMNGII